MRPAVLAFAPLLLLPFVGCDSNLTEPVPDASVTALQQPPSAEPLFLKGEGDQIQDKIQEALKNQDGSCKDAETTTQADAEKQQAAGTRNRKGMQESLAAADTEDARLGQQTKTQARTKKGDGSPIASKEKAAEERRQMRSKYGPE